MSTAAEKETDLQQTQTVQALLSDAAMKRLGRLAVMAGLGDFKLSDKELKAGFADLAGRFQS